MAKKVNVLSKIKKSAGALWGRHKEEVLGLLANFAEAELKDLAFKLKDLPRIRKAIRRKIWAMKLCMVGGLALVLGLAALLNSIKLQPFEGFWLIVVGLVLVVIGKIVKAV